MVKKFCVVRHNERIGDVVQRQARVRATRPPATCRRLVSSRRRYDSNRPTDENPISRWREIRL